MTQVSSKRPRWANRSRQKRLQSGFTLVELLVTVTLMLMLIFAIVSVFQWMGDGIVDARAKIEISGQLRSATFRFNQDIAGLTAPARPLSDSNSDHGYLLIMEGEMKDVGAFNPPTVPGSIASERDSAVGDYDDFISFTARSQSQPFRGMFQGSIIESTLAEIAWWAIWNDTDGDGYRDSREVTLYRRVMLIRPDLNPAGADLASFQNANDLSVRKGGNGLVANSLADLSIRANRFAHAPGAFPNQMDLSQLAPKSGNELGEDVILSDLLAFDIQVYDPYAPLRMSAGTLVSPSDPGWSGGSSSDGRGGYVNLNFANSTSVSHPSNQNEQAGFSGPPRPKSKLQSLALPGGNRSTGVYDTWTHFYEQDGVDQDSLHGPDQGRNGFDDDGKNGVDDPGERETEPPYSIPLRGMKISFRIIESSTLQPRQTSVITVFIPE